MESALLTSVEQADIDKEIQEAITAAEAGESLAGLAMNSARVGSFRAGFLFYVLGCSRCMFAGFCFHSASLFFRCGAFPFLSECAVCTYFRPRHQEFAFWSF